MPIYEFLCGECGAGFEELCTLAEAESCRVECPECGAKKAEKQMSTFASMGGETGVRAPSCGSSGFG